MTEKKEDSKKEKSLEEKFVNTHAEFLKAIKEVYPLAVLGSLCIAISAFTQNNYPQAQAYAITGAALFLVAFVSSLLIKIFPFYILVVVAYSATAMAMIMLFLVVLEFSNSVAMVSRVMSIIVIVLTVIVFGSSIAKTLLKTKNRVIRLTATVSLVSLSLFIVIVLVSTRILPESFEIIAPIGIVALLVFFVSTALAMVNMRKERNSSL